MRKQRIAWWIFPVIGLICGLLVALVYVGGLGETWQFVGNPGSRVQEIIGLADQQLYARGENEQIYSFQYTNWRMVSSYFSTPVEWLVVENAPSDILPNQEIRTSFIIWPPLFTVQQLYALELPVNEGEFLAEFAHSADGNVTYRNHGITGLSMLAYNIFPVMGAV